MKKILVLFAVTLGLVSCDLTTLPETSLTPEIALGTFEGLDGAAAVTYAAFTSESWYGLNLQLYPDVMCGNCVAGVPMNSGRGMSWQQWNFTAAGGFSMYGNAYVNILRCNNVIFKIKSEPETYLSEKGVSQQDLDNLMAECLFVRAYCYFDLVRWYAQPYAVAKAAAEGTPQSLGAPIVNENPDISVLDKPARATAVANYQNIVSDLKTALDIIEPGYTRKNVYDTKCCVSEGAIEALLARVYLYMEEFELAATHATNVLNSGMYEIASANEYANPADSYYGFWNETTWSEVGEIIFGAYNGPAEGSTIIGNVTSPEDYGDIRVSEDLLALFEDGDIRKEMLRTSNEHSGYYWPNKYQGKDGAIAFASIPMIRTSEMYLIRAEARLRGANPDINGATADLNVITSNRNASPYATVTLDDVFNERRKELAFEGHIFHDYKRLQRDLARVDVSSDMNKDVPADSKLWCMPIAESEFDVNPNLVQNPGW